MDKFDGDVFDSSFWGQTFQDDVCQELRDSGALALKGQSLELLDPESAKSKVLIAVRQKILTTYQDENCRDAQEHGTFFLREIEDMQTHTHWERESKNPSMKGYKKYTSHHQSTTSKCHTQILKKATWQPVSG